jgi:RimJ/RimL family protein N-acetyltransferase
MKLQRYRTAAAFLESAQPFLLAAEAENSLILGIAGDLARESGPGTSAAYFATVQEGGKISVCAFSSVPNRVGITRAAHPAGLPLLASDIADACPGVRYLSGPEPTAGAFADLLAAQFGARSHLSMGQRIHELRAVAPLANLPHGRLRPAGMNDLDLVTGWVAEFMVEAGDHGDAGEIVRDRLPRGLLYLWEDGEVVSMAGWTGQTPNGVRIVLVYTPRSLRGRGYATACVAALSTRMLQSNRYCCLYTDLANPTSNAIYHRIGYRPVCDAAMYSVRDI